MKEAVTILLIDDSTQTRQLMMLLLDDAELPYYAVSVIPVSTMALAVEYLQNSHPSLIVSDLLLPDSDGIMTFRKLKAAAPDIPIVIISGLDDADMTHTIMSEGAGDYIVKGTMTPNALVQRILRAVARGKQMPTTEEPTEPV